MCWSSKVLFVWNFCKSLEPFNLWLSKMLFYCVWHLWELWEAISTPQKNKTKKIFKDFSVELRSVVQKKGGNGLHWLTTNTSAFHDCMMEAKIAFNRMRSWTQQWNKPSHHPTKSEMSRVAADTAVQNKQKTVFSCTKREITFGGGVVFAKEKRHLTEKFQKLSANANNLEERREVFLCMCALLKIPRGDRGRDNTV